MLNVVEAFSGIGSQAKALKNINVNHRIVATIEWDINAIYAYDIIHNGEQNLIPYENVTKDELVTKLLKYSLSGNGKEPLKHRSLSNMSLELLKRIDCAINRTKNLVSITDVHARDIPLETNVLTYSFPCQDLSICGAWHGNHSGINRNANNRSGMLWEVERILQEYVEEGRNLPRFLLMENVSNILSEKHRDDFEEWKSYLSSIGYVNQVYTLNSLDFGVPQRRIRTYMVSVLSNNAEMKNYVKNYFNMHNIQNNIRQSPHEVRDLLEYLRVDYNILQYKIEADISNPNDTPSRRQIYKDNTLLFRENEILNNFVKTITTKQDRNPNSGVIEYLSNDPKKSNYRNITPRECFLLMGFDEDDFQRLIDSNFLNRGKNFLVREKLVKLAGNSIVVDVLESIFFQINELNELLEYNFMRNI